MEGADTAHDLLVTSQVSSLFIGCLFGIITSLALKHSRLQEFPHLELALVVRYLLAFIDHPYGRSQQTPNSNHAPTLPYPPLVDLHGLLVP